MTKSNVNRHGRQYETGEWIEVASFLSRRYSHQLSDTSVSIALVTDRDLPRGQDGVGWAVAETPEFFGVYATRREAESAARLLANALDDTPVPASDPEQI